MSAFSRTASPCVWGANTLELAKVATDLRYSIGACPSASAEDAGGRRSSNSEHAVAKQTTSMNLKSLTLAMIEAWRVTSALRAARPARWRCSRKGRRHRLQHAIEGG